MNESLRLTKVNPEHPGASVSNAVESGGKLAIQRFSPNAYCLRTPARYRALCERGAMHGSPKFLAQFLALSPSSRHLHRRTIRPPQHTRSKQSWNGFWITGFWFSSSAEWLRCTFSGTDMADTNTARRSIAKQRKRKRRTRPPIPMQTLKMSDIGQCYGIA